MNLSNATSYSARDGATAALRKVGITKADYDDFIVAKDGRFYVDIESARKFGAKPAAKADLAAETAAEAALDETTEAEVVKKAVKEAILDRKIAKPVTKTKPAKPAAKPAKAKSLSQTIRDLIIAVKPAKAKSLSQTIRDLIIAGKTNQQVWDKLSAAGLLVEKQHYYPAWYRCELRRAGYEV